MKPELLDSIRARFIERCRDDIQKLRELRHKPGGGTVDDTLLRTVHGLAGAGGTLGYPEVSRQASDLEALLIDYSSAEVDKCRALDALIASLERMIDAGPHPDNTVA